MSLSFNEKSNPADFKKVRVIGQGGFGSVFELEYLPSHLRLAGKQINEEALNEEAKNALLRENNIMKQINSPYAVRYYGTIIFEGKLTVLMDFCDRGSIRDIMDFHDKTLNEQQIAFVMHDLLIALKLLHKMRIVHRDIKAANILANSKGELKLTDFGVSRQFAIDATTFSTVSTIGTPYWMAPEVIIENQKYTFPADIWSVGTTAVEMAEGGPPYCEYNPTQAMQAIRQHGFPGFRQGNNLSEVFQDFVSKCMVVDPKQRATIEELLRHPFVKQIDKLDRMAVLEDLIKEEIDFSQLLPDDEEEEEEEEEADDDDDDDDDGYGSFKFNQKTIISAEEKTEPKAKPPKPEEKPKQEEKPAPPPEPVSPPPPEPVQKEEPPPPPKPAPEPAPEVKPQEKKSRPKVQFDETAKKPPGDGKRKFNPKTRGVTQQKKKTKGYQTFIKPSTKPIDQLYTKEVSNKKPPAVNPNILKSPPPTTTSQPAPTGQSKVKKIGLLIIALAILYIALGPKKFMLILLILLPILFFVFKN